MTQLPNRTPPPREPNLKFIKSKATWFCNCGVTGATGTLIEAEKQAGAHQCNLTFPRKKIRINVSEEK